MMLKISIFFNTFLYLVQVSNQEPRVRSVNSLSPSEQNHIMTGTPTYTELEEFIKSWFGLNKFDPVCSLPLEEKKELCKTILELPFFKSTEMRYSRTETEAEDLNCESYSINVANTRYDRLLFICPTSSSSFHFGFSMLMGDLMGDDDGILIGNSNKKNSLAIFRPSGQTLKLYAIVESIILRPKTPYPVIKF